MELSERFFKLEKIVGPKNPAKTYAERAAKWPRKLAPKNKKDPVELIRTRDDHPSSKSLIIKPPAGISDPIRYVARANDPSKEGIKIISNKRVIVRLDSVTETLAMKRAPALKDCEFPYVYYTTRCKVAEDLFDQNKAIQVFAPHSN